MIHIMDQVGRLPDTHVHCAQLAETTLQKALEDYQRKVTEQADGSRAGKLPALH
jgi:hypothetical protein